MSATELRRILERLDQQDRNADSIAEQLRRSTSDIAMHLKEGTAVIATDLRVSTARIAKDLEDHTDLDNERFDDIVKSLKQLVDYQNQQKGGVKIIIWMASGLGASLALAVTWFSTIR